MNKKVRCIICNEGNYLHIGEIYTVVDIGRSGKYLVNICEPLQKGLILYGYYLPEHFVDLK